MGHRVGCRADRGVCRGASRVPAVSRPRAPWCRWPRAPCCRKPRADARDVETHGRRQRHHLRQHLQRRHLGHRRGHREADVGDSGQHRHSDLPEVVARSDAAVRARCDLREGRDLRSRDRQVARVIHADRRQHQDADLEHDARSAGQIPDPRDQEVHAAHRSLGDRPADAGAVRPRGEKDRADDSVAEGRGARRRGRHLLAGRQAHVPVRRGSAHLRHRDVHRSRSVGGVASDRTRRRQRRARRSRSDERRARFLHRAADDAGSGAEPADHGHRPHRAHRQEDPVPSGRSGARPGVRARARPQARLRPAADDRGVRALDVRHRELPRHRPHAVPRPAAHEHSRQQQQQLRLHPPGRQHHRPLRRGVVQAGCGRSRSTAI